MTGWDIEVERFAHLTSPLFACHLSEVDRYSIPNAFDAFKF
jgi:hypothetical protein